MCHYVYMLKSNRDQRKYIGVRSCECDPFDDTYMSSSKEDSEYVNDCIKTIIKQFNTREEANSFEIYLHNLHDVAANPEFFNKAKATSEAFCTAGNKDVAIKIALSQMGSKNSMYGRKGRLAPNYGKKLSTETKNKIREKAIGRKASDETKVKMSEKRKGLNNSGAKLANIYCVYTDSLIAENVCISEWSDNNGVIKGLTATTQGGRRKSHKGLYARYI